MKPKIVKVPFSPYWRCGDEGYGVLGVTPRHAYNVWQRNRHAARLKKKPHISRKLCFDGYWWVVDGRKADFELYRAAMVAAFNMNRGRAYMH